MKLRSSGGAAPRCGQGDLSERLVDYHRQFQSGSGSFVGQRQKGHHSSFVQLLSLQESLCHTVQKSSQSFIYFDNKTEKKCKTTTTKKNHVDLEKGKANTMCSFMHKMANSYF